MNEQIKQLWVQAAETTQGDSWEEQTKFMERYTKLIVLECYEHCKGQVLDKEVADTNELSYNDAVGDCANGLLQHFGVEE